MSSRVKYLDYAKGFAIICMLLSHAIPQENDIIRTIISGFDMPLFFVVCGCIIAIKDKDDISFSGYLRKRIRTIFVPYVIFGVALSLFYCALSALSNNEIDLWYYLVRLLTFQGVDSLWFLPVYFFAETLFVFIFKKFNSISRIIIFSFFVVSVCIFYNMFYIFEGSFILRFIIRILIALIFVYIGYILYKYVMKLYIYIIGLFLGVVGSVLNGSVDISDLELHNPILFFLSAFLLCTSILGIFNCIEKSVNTDLRFFRLWGENTIIVLCTNNLVIEIIRLADHFITYDFMIKSGILGNFLFFVIITVIELIIIKIFSNKLGFVFGRYRRKQ